MASFYGSYVNGMYRCRIDVSVTDSSSTQSTVAVSVYIEMADYYHDNGDNFLGRANPGNGYGSEVRGADTYLSGPTSLLITSKSYAVTRTHAAQSISVAGQVRNDWTSGYEGPSTASGTASVTARPSYAVTYNANGGSGAPSSQTKWYGEALTLSSTKPTRTGYTFRGWGTSSSATTVSYAAGATYTGNAALSLYALWSPITYSVTYNANGGSSTPTTQTKAYGSSVTLASAITRSSATTKYTVTYNYNGSGASSTTATATKTTSYTFYRWNTKSDGSGTNYSAGASYSTNASLSLYATWTSSASTTSVTLPTPTRSGYTFGGWYRESACTNKVGNGGASYTPTASTTLYAKWTLSSWTVSYDANGGSGAPAAQTKVSGTALTLSSTVPKRSGYTFLGWSTNKTGTGTAYAAGGSYTSNAAATLYAVWAGVQVTSLTAYRSNSSGTRAEDGAYGHLSAGWKAIGTIAGTVAVTATAGSTSITSSLSNRTGTKTASADLSNTSVATFGGSYAESTSVKVTVTATLSVSYGGSTQTVSASRVATIPKVFHLLTFLHDGTGLAIGAMATLSNTFEVAIQTVFNNVNAIIKAPNVDRDGTAPSENQYSRQFRFADADNDAVGYMDGYQLTTGETGVRFVAFAGPSGDSVYNTFRVGKLADGTNVYYMTDPAAFRIAINAAAVTNQSTQSVNFGEGSGTVDFTIYANVTNGSSSDYGDRVGLWAKTNGIALYNSTDSSYDWDLTLPVSVENGGSGRSAVYKNTTVSSVIAAASGRTISSVTYAEWGKVAQLSVSVSGFAASTGSQSVGTVVEGKRPVYAVYATAVTSSNAPYATLAADGAMSVYWASAPGTSTGYTIRFVYLLA